MKLYKRSKHLHLWCLLKYHVFSLLSVGFAGAFWCFDYFLSSTLLQCQWSFTRQEKKTKLLCILKQYAHLSDDAWAFLRNIIKLCGILSQNPLCPERLWCWWCSSNLLFRTCDASIPRTFTCPLQLVTRQGSKSDECCTQSWLRLML